MGFSIYTIILSGIFSKSKYSMLGAIRASSQRVSYEIAFSIYLITLMVSINIFEFIPNFSFCFIILVLPFLIMVLAELNRAPFDFSEGERELVSGYNVEYSSVSFVLLFLSEYGSLLFFRVLISCLFFDFSLLIRFLVFSVLIFVRSSYPRYRYDLIIGFF